MKTDLSKLIDQVADNRRMPREKVLERLKEIISWWAMRDLHLIYPLSVEFNEQEGRVEIYSCREVVEIVENEYSQIEFQEAIKIKSDVKLGDTLLVRVRPDLANSLFPGALRELCTGVREEYPRKGETGRVREETGQFGENFDGIGEGQKGSVGHFKEFYHAFKQDVQRIKVSIEDLEKNLIPTDALCERCGSRMEIRWENSIKTGGYRPFLACSNYPTCKFTQKIETEIRKDKTGTMNGQGVSHDPLTKIHRPRNLPNIPDLPEQGTSVSPSRGRLEEDIDMEVSEPDTPDLISILIDERTGIKIDQKEPPPSDELEPNCEQILLEIERILAEHDNLQVKKKLNELYVEVTLSNRSFTTVFHVYNQMITAKSLLPFVKDAAVDLLELCGQADFTSSIGKVSQRGEHFYIIKSSCPLRGVSRKILWQMVFQPILETSKAIEIIEGYLKNDDIRE